MSGDPAALARLAIRERAALGVVCPRCGAAPGAECDRVQRGTFRGRPHARRVVLGRLESVRTAAGLPPRKRR